MSVRKNKSKHRAMMLFLVVGCAALTTWGLKGVVADTSARHKDADRAIQYADALSTAFEQAATDIKPSLVSIRSIRHIKTTGGIIDNGNHQLQGFRGFPFNDDLLRRFFGRLPTPTEMPPVQGLGSGGIVSSDGYILTNNHVVGDADEVLVRIGDGREIDAKVIGTDPMSDLAVIRVKEKDLTPARLGDSDEIKIGQWVVAAGSPFGLSDTVTAGIVSAKGRSNVRIAEFEDFIQTDAAINPGNSGGPLIDLHGNVVGINTAIASHNGGSNGVGFAIPIDMAKHIMDSLIHEGKVVRGWLGVAIQPLDTEMAESFGYQGTDGVLIGEVIHDAPGESAGLEAGDIVVSVDGKPVTDVTAFRNLIASAAPGTKIKLRLFRDGEYTNKTVKLGTLDKSYLKTARRGMRGPHEDSVDQLGMTVETPDAQMLEGAGLPEDAPGVLVVAVEPGGLADLAGIQTGNLITRVQGKSVRDARDFDRMIGRINLEHGVRLQIQSSEGQRFAFLRAEQS